MSGLETQPGGLLHKMFYLNWAFPFLVIAAGDGYLIGT